MPPGKMGLLPQVMTSFALVPSRHRLVSQNFRVARAAHVGGCRWGAAEGFAIADMQLCLIVEGSLDEPARRVQKPRTIACIEGRRGVAHDSDVPVVQHLREFGIRKGVVDRATVVRGQRPQLLHQQRVVCGEVWELQYWYLRRMTAYAMM